MFIRFLITLALLIVMPVYAARQALVIGNDNYTSVSKLQKAGNDATAMARELRGAGFAVQLHRDLNYRAMVRAVENFAAGIKGGDEVVVFFAGHGVQIKSGAYLLPTDIEATTETEVQQTSYELNMLTEKLSDAKAAFSLVMVDACRDNPLKAKGRSVGNTRGLSAIEPPKGQMVVYSASKGQQALDRLSEKDANPNSVFTREFIRRMKTPGVRIQDLMAEVQDAVEALAGTVKHEQRPALYNEARGNFYFFGPTTIQTVPRKPDSIANEDQIEQQAWSAAQSGNSAAGYSAYLEEYPKGRFASAARVARASLGPQVAATPAPQHVPSTSTVPTPGPLVDSSTATTLAQKKYDSGATDKEIKIGNIGPYSGPASAYGTIGKSISAYIDKVNAEGGVNGRKIKLISLDDGYNPAKTVAQVRKLVEEEEVLLVFNPLGTPTNSAIHKYMNVKRVPQLFVSSAATKWGDPRNFPWTMGWQPTYQAEARIYVEHILETKPNARIAVLYQNDDYGKDYLKGFEDALGDKAKTMIVAKQNYEVTDSTLDSQLMTLKASGADTFVNMTAPKFAAMVIKKSAEIGWQPQHYLSTGAASFSAFMHSAGFGNGVGIISAQYMKDPTDPQWANDPAFKEWSEWMRRYYPGGNLADSNNVFGYGIAQTLMRVLKQCGDNLTRENVMKQAASLDMTLPMLLPGVNIKTSADDFYPIERSQLARFDGRTWLRFGRIYGR
jgi:branched-chain amino acid transport system substrate-binding protein